MVRRRRHGAVAWCGAVWLAAGCAAPSPDPRDFAVAGLPPIPADVRSSEVVQASVKPPAKPPGPGKPVVRPGLPEIPAELPGSDAPPVPPGPNLSGRPFPTLPPLGPDPEPTGEKPLTLAELEQAALEASPTVRQAAADVAAARGRAEQAGLYPNPEVGYAAEQINSGTGTSTRGQQGGYVSFVIKTAGKLQLARLAGLMEYYTAQVALRRAQIDLVNQVRANYFAVLVARESVAVNRALARFTEEIYRAQIGLVQGGEQAAYEPLQSYVLAVQARGNLVQARNRYAAAWKQLAASLGRPDLPPAPLAGRADAPAPDYRYDQLVELALGRHTDLQAAHNRILQARYNLRLAEVTPIPDINASVVVQKDWSQPPFNTQVSIQAGGQLPLFDRNQGNILAAKADLARAIQEVPRVRNDLSARLAQAFEQYENARTLVGYYRDAALPNLVRVYRAVYQRYAQDPAKISYNDVVVAQQNLAGGLATYLTFLGQQWQAAVELAALAQTEELYFPDPAEGTPGIDWLLIPGEAVTPPGSKPATPKKE
jgi:cobalt-zinc-cadmium efflux system outer membrane protein